MPREEGSPQEVLMGLRPSILSNTPHFEHLMMCGLTSQGFNFRVVIAPALPLPSY
jgi:hypothetical protein